LKELFFFDCNCQLCENTSAYVQIEKDLIQIDQLREAVPNLLKNGNPVETLEKAKTLLELMNKNELSIISPDYISETLLLNINAALNVMNKSSDIKNQKTIRRYS